MPEVDQLNPSSHTDKIRDALAVSTYSYPDNSMLAVQRQDSKYSDKNLLLEYMAILSLNKKSGDLQRKINEMRKLSHNWDTYGAEPPNEEARNAARELLVCMEGRKFLPTDAVASAEGGVALSFTAGNRYADIECLNSGEILAVTVNERGEPIVWEVQKNTSGFMQTIEHIHAHISP